MNQSFKVSGSAKLLEFLFAELSDVKKTRIRQWLKNGNVSVNLRVTTRFDHPLKAGDEVRVDSAKTRAITPAARFHIRILYEDDFLLAIHKPAGLLSIATEKVQHETAIFAVNDYLNEKASAGKSRPMRREKRVFIVHRLDRDVSGLLLFAKDEETKFRLQESWGSFTKEYLAVVEGCPKELSGKIESYLTENKILRVFSGPRLAASQKAITHYEVLQPNENYSLVKVRLETGRKHQIRVHLADLGCPVAGDKIYGAESDPAGRILLHAWRMELIHPETGQPLKIICPTPDSFYQLTGAKKL